MARKMQVPAYEPPEVGVHCDEKRGVLCAVVNTIDIEDMLLLNEPPVSVLVSPIFIFACFPTTGTTGENQLSPAPRQKWRSRTSKSSILSISGSCKVHAPWELFPQAKFNPGLLPWDTEMASL